MTSIFQNESITEENILIHENIEKRQLSLNTDDSMWNEILKSYYDDFRFVERMLTMQSIRAEIERSFDRRKWMIIDLELWHLRLNLLRLIHKIYWDDFSSLDASTLQYVANFWNRNNINTSNDFAKLETLLKHFYQVKVSTLMLRRVRMNRKKNFQIAEKVVNYLQSRSHQAYMKLIMNLFVTIHSSKFKTISLQLMKNEIAKNHLRFIRHMNAYLQLTYVIKHEDIDLLRYALRDVCVMFQTSKDSTYKYAIELIR